MAESGLGGVGGPAAVGAALGDASAQEAEDGRAGAWSVEEGGRKRGDEGAAAAGGGGGMGGQPDAKKQKLDRDCVGLTPPEADGQDGGPAAGVEAAATTTSSDPSRNSPASASRQPQQPEERAYTRASPWSALRRSNHPSIAPSRSIYSYERLNHIQEGTYGVVFRARAREPLPASTVIGGSAAEREGGRGKDSASTRTSAAALEVAVKKLKLPSTGLSSSSGGFPITSLREIQTLLHARSTPHILALHEVCIGKTLDQIFLVLEFMEHDLKSLLTSMHRTRSGFAPSEIKTLMHQLLVGVAGLHRGWVVHRDLKSSNLLVSNRGQLKVGDFGLARRYGDPIDGWSRSETRQRGAEGSTSRKTDTTGAKEELAAAGGMTDLVCTLWYRAPELLLVNLIHQARESQHDKSQPPPSSSIASHPLFKYHSRSPPPAASQARLPLYDEKIDMWSIGCIFAELLLTSTTGTGLFQGKDEADQLRCIENVLGKPNTTIWPHLPRWQGLPHHHHHHPSKPPPSSTSALQDEVTRIKTRLESAFAPTKLTPATLDLLFQLLHWDPTQRISAKDALQHDYFAREAPGMAHPDSFGSFPSVAAGDRVVAVNTPSAPNKHVVRGGGVGGSAKETGKAKEYKMEFDFTS